MKQFQDKVIRNVFIALELYTQVIGYDTPEDVADSYRDAVATMER